MKITKVGILMNGVTGRMGTNQHLMRSIMPIIQQGGIRVNDEEVIIPDPVLIGRDRSKLEKLAELTGLAKISTDLDSLLNDQEYQVYFDAQSTLVRGDALRKAIQAGKHVYCEKPAVSDSQTTLILYNICRQKNIKNGVVQDKLWLPGLLKLKKLIENGFFGQILSVKGDFGYWVFEGHSITPQRPSWNYRKEDGGGIISDMFCHWRYILDNLFGSVRSVSALGVTHIEERIDEASCLYKCTAEDAAYAMFELEKGIVAQFNSSWTTRVRRDDLLMIQVDGTLGSAVAGLRECYIQKYADTPKPVWNPDVPQEINFYEGWTRILDDTVYENAFKIQWELFLKHVVKDEPFPWNLKEGAKGIQLAEKAYESWEKRSWIDVPIL